MFGYWWQVIVRALGSSLDVVGQSLGGLSFAIILVICPWIYLYVKLHKTGKVKGMFWRSFRKAVFQSILLPAIFWLPVFIWHLAKTPYMMQKESQQQINDALTELRKAPTRAYVDNLQKEIESLRYTLSSRPSNPKPCLHPLDFKEEVLEPVFGNYPFRRSVSISSKIYLPRPRFWIFTDIPGVTDQTDSPLPCNIGSGGMALDYDCRIPIGPDRPLIITLTSERQFAIICVGLEGKSK